MPKHWDSFLSYCMSNLSNTSWTMLTTLLVATYKVTSFTTSHMGCTFPDIKLNYSSYGTSSEFRINFINRNPLTIIGISVDAQRMTLTLPDDAKKWLIDELKFWIQKPPKLSSSSFKLKYWEWMAGWFNWALNVYPLLCPELNSVYAKTSRKQNREQRIYINNAIRDDFLWALTHIENSDGIHLLRSFSWCPSLADFILSLKTVIMPLLLSTLLQMWFFILKLYACCQLSIAFKPKPLEAQKSSFTQTMKIPLTFSDPSNV